MVKMNRDIFIQELQKLDIIVDEEKLNLLNKYYDYLIEYNSHTNLTTITEKNDVYLKHFYDSLTLSRYINLNEIESMIDIGSGAGFPGVVLKIFFPHINVTILDSNNKKTTFVSNLITKLGLNNIEVVNARAEDYAKENLNKYDLCTSRAVAFIDIISELSLPFINLNGKVALMKGNIDNEIKILNNYQQKLNIKNYIINSFVLPNKDERNIIILTKNGLTKKVLNYSQIVKRSKIWNGK
ncbi:MAG: 16S rRNA (guanine(527)-N(7))-methyltransferase RsmG [Firmicutes bacterium]|nr:16S rRNA (guanine(527)-N(7))-methyltransferase RsmG [Bacillota bacterium]